jgi:hypothetical protein
MAKCVSFVTATFAVFVLFWYNLINIRAWKERAVKNKRKSKRASGKSNPPSVLYLGLTSDCCSC